MLTFSHARLTAFHVIVNIEGGTEDVSTILSKPMKVCLAIRCGRPWQYAGCQLLGWEVLTASQRTRTGSNRPQADAILPLSSQSLKGPVALPSQRRADNKRQIPPNKTSAVDRIWSGEKEEKRLER